MKNNDIAESPLSFLNSIRRDHIIFGIFLILQGIVLYVTLGGTAFNVFVVIGALLALAGALDTVTKIFRQKKTWLNILMILLLLLSVAIIAVIAIAMLAIPQVRLKNMMLSVSLVAIINGLVNIVESVRIERNKVMRAVLIMISIICIGFGIAYWATYERAPEMLTQARGIIFMATGAINVWLGIRAGSAIKQKTDD